VFGVGVVSGAVSGETVPVLTGGEDWVRLEVETGDEAGPGGISVGVGAGEDEGGRETVTLERAIEDKSGLREGAGIRVELTAGGGGVKAGGAADPESLDGGVAPAATVHALTTWMRDSPFTPVTGVNVRVHVSVTGPASV